jgi:hypothetical protein
MVDEMHVLEFGVGESKTFSVGIPEWKSKGFEATPFV